MKQPSETLGDGPIEDRYRDMMNGLAAALDEMLNGHANGPKPSTGFVLMVFSFNDHEGRCNYISNAKREDVVSLMREQIARFEDQPEQKGQA
ncbi:MAG: hypothetical protein QM744_14420 [Mesorhizobium sp.]